MNESVPSKCKQKKGEILSLESVSKKSIIFRWINYLYGKEEIVIYQKYRSITIFFIIKKHFTQTSQVTSLLLRLSPVLAKEV